MIEDLRVTFKKHADEYLKFDRVRQKLNARPDLCAMLLLDSLMPRPGVMMISSSKDGVIYLEPDSYHLPKYATEEEIVDLIRCGVRLNDANWLVISR